MAGRAISSVTLSFGLVAIPVQVLSATESAGRISFNLLHKGCGSRLKQQYVCVEDGEVVERSEMIKGYEFSKGQYVEFAPDELKALEAIGSNSVDIVEFVPLASIDPIYFDKTYFLAPDRGANKPYALLSDALADTGQCAIGNWAARGKQHTVALRAVRGVLVMQQLYFASEVRSVEEVEVPQAELKEAEKKLARQLIAQQAHESFNASAYTDDVKARIDTAIEDKVNGKEITLSATPPAAATNVIDLMDVLRRSLNQAASGAAVSSKQRRPPRSAEPARPRRAARR
jgi:DNA end-binding protein Ku